MSLLPIKSMQLYGHLDRIDKELRAAGLDPEGPLTVAQLSPLDNLHYHGTEAVALAAERLGLGVASRVADIGSGLGGPARYLAATRGCRVTAVELQADLDALARRLTRACGLEDRVEHRCADALARPLEAGAYDAAVSWLALYHVPDQPRLFAHLAEALRPGGRLLAEDLYARGPFTAEEAVLVRDGLYGPGLQSLPAYRAVLETAGFEAVETLDMTEDWSAYTAERLARYRQERPRHLAVAGAETVAAMEAFYETVSRLFAGGRLGGLRLEARKA